MSNILPKARVVLPLLPIVTDFIERYPSEYEKGRTLKNPFMSELRERVEEAFAPIVKAYGIKLKPIAGAGSLRKELQYISFPKPPNRTICGFYPIIFFDFAAKTLRFFIGFSEDRELPASLVKSICDALGEYLADFKTRSRWGTPMWECALADATDEEMTNTLYRLLDSYEACLERFGAELSDFFGAEEGSHEEVPLEDEEESKMKGENIIYFGPPGTGKTYTLSSEWFPRFTSRASSLSPDERLRELVKDESWWVVVGAALYDLEKARVPELLEHPLIKARHAVSATKRLGNAIWANLQTHTGPDCKTVSYTARQEPFIFSKDEDSMWSIVKEAVRESAPEVLTLLNASRDGGSLDEVKRYEMVTFHQAFSYEDFIEGIKPVLGEEDGGRLRYEIVPGVFKRLCDRARADLSHGYAIFIDEINRGNVANIFGELISLIEGDKREGERHALTVTLPYSKESFSVPANVSIIGTMNSADRSVEALDTALRRRFEFRELRPQAKVLTQIGSGVPGVDLERLLEAMNSRIERLLDRDHQIGHGYFVGVRSLSELQRVFKEKILPLLQEYFFGDLGRIGLVLGERFIRVRNGGGDLASFDHPEREIFTDRRVFELIDPREFSAADFCSVYGG